jgi:3-methyladenine DNA glycosylase AlkD
MTKTEIILKQLQALGSASVKKIFLNHGAVEPVYGVKVADLKVILKKIKNDQPLAMDLYDSGVSDAMYLAGLAADGSKMSKKQLQDWANKASWYMISENTVPWVTAESPFAHELGLEWIESKQEMVACAGWATLGGLLALKPDSEIDKKEVTAMLKRIEKTIHQSPNRVRYTMNSYVIHVGGYVPELTELAIATAKKIGVVHVEMGNTACEVPSPPVYIQKMKDKGSIGKKKKTLKC